MENIETFSPDEKLLILAVKDKLKHQLFEFNMTIEKLGKNMVNSYFVTGGCIGSLLRAEVPSDYDIYFLSESSATPIVNLYTKDPSYQNEVATYEDKYRDVQKPANTPSNAMVITENAVTLKNKLQLITKHYGTPKEIRSTFDFVHCLPYYESVTDKLYISRDQFDLNMTKKLKTNNVDNLTTYRANKFTDKGWTWL
jgi:hypothetical protein